MRTMVYGTERSLHEIMPTLVQEGTRPELLSTVRCY